MAYDHRTIERKWQDRWAREGHWRARDDATGREKYYALIEFPYPSGEGLHVGHLRSYTAMDVIARKRRMEGGEVLFPIGWDAFGLPAENYALKTGQHPRVTTEKNCSNFRRQLQAMGFSFDWSREVNTTDPAYYRWTQWIFLKLLEHGLAYKATMPINWCTRCKIGLANEEVVGGVCERCGGAVEKRNREQWMLKITAYAEKLLAGLETVDYIERAKVQQRNWIGRSEGAEIEFRIIDASLAGPAASDPQRARETARAGGPPLRVTRSLASVRVFTTRPDTLFGATYLVLAPEHPTISDLRFQISNWFEVETYIARARSRTEIERTTEEKEKTGVALEGVRAVNPANGEEIPIWIADYVLAHYGTGAIMAVPAHDERDFVFAKQYGLPIRIVICPNFPEPICPVLTEAYVGDGHLVDSGTFTGMDSEAAQRAITEAVGGTTTVTYKLRDWVFSRQRYWGEPIPVVFCAQCVTDRRGGFHTRPREDVNSSPTVDMNGIPHAVIPVPEDQLPVLLPNVERYQPTDTGDSPLAAIPEWVNTTCPRCGGSAKRETDVMPNWAGSSWYFLRYCDPTNDAALADPEKLRHWMPVDWYNGGMEHTTLHLLYSRFWNLFLHDIGVVPVAEPYRKRTSHGLILAADGEKMSKSRGNVVSPDEIVDRFGADAVRCYEMFIGPFDQPVPWSTDGLIGCRRFLERVAALLPRVEPRPAEGAGVVEDRDLHRAIKKVSEDIEAMRFNTAVSALMEYANALGKRDRIPFMEYVTFLTLLAPFAPHFCEELHERLPVPSREAEPAVRASPEEPSDEGSHGHCGSISVHPWPTYDPALVIAEEVDIVVQVNGKVRATLRVPAGITKSDAQARALATPNVAAHLAGRAIRNVIFVPGRLVNFVV